MNQPSANFDELVFFAYDIAQDISSSMQENNWTSEDCCAWETQGFEVIRDFLLEDIDATQLACRKRALVASKKHVVAQTRLFTTFYNSLAKGEAKKKQFALTVSAINIKHFMEDVRGREKQLLDVLQQGVVSQAKRKKSP